MGIIITSDSHLDHGLTGEQIAHILHTFRERDEFFIETIELPLSHGTVPCALRGPAVGDLPIGGDVFWAFRGDREYQSRMIDLPPTTTRLVTVIAGPHGEHPCVLYTAYGGPLAPKEPDDPSLTPEEREVSEAFWAEHALTDPEATFEHELEESARILSGGDILDDKWGRG